MITFATMTTLEHREPLEAMMSRLYEEDPPSRGSLPASFTASIETLVRDPAKGRIVLFLDGGSICGYALLVPYFSNEFGGILLFLDEIYVEPTHRGRGIAKQFIALAEETRPFDPVAMALEVSPRNTKARALYTSIGFAIRSNAIMVKELPPISP